MSIDVSLEDFPAEIRLWWDAAERLGACADIVDGLVPDSRAFSLLGDATAEDYDRFRTHVWVLLLGGARAARDIAESLRQTHVSYLAIDTSTKARLDGLPHGG